MSTITLLSPSGKLSRTELASPAPWTKPAGALRSRLAYAAAHVVPSVHAENTPGSPAQIDWDATLDFRRTTYSWGLGVADAMDTAQRNMGLDTSATRELIARSADVARQEGGSLVIGVNTDHLEDHTVPLNKIVDAYAWQLDYAEDQGVDSVLMASRHLARSARTPEDYRAVYRDVLSRASRPVVLHWLGSAFDPALAGYFGSRDWTEAAVTLLQIIDENQDKVAGVKMSLLDATAEIWVRDQLPDTVRMFTGDDFNYVELIAPRETAGLDDNARSHSDALLGAFAAFAPAASAAIQALDAGKQEVFRTILEPTVELSRHIFSEPTFYYKTGIAFLSWLNGRQPAFQMVGGLHAARSLPHLSRVVDLANKANVLERPELAAERWHSLLHLNGVDW